MVQTLKAKRDAKPQNTGGKAVSLTANPSIDDEGDCKPVVVGLDKFSRIDSFAMCELAASKRRGRTSRPVLTRRSSSRASSSAVSLESALDLPSDGEKGGDDFKRRQPVYPGTRRLPDALSASSVNNGTARRRLLLSKQKQQVLDELDDDYQLAKVLSYSLSGGPACQKSRQASSSLSSEAFEPPRLLTPADARNYIVQRAHTLDSQDRARELALAQAPRSPYVVTRGLVPWQGPTTGEGAEDEWRRNTRWRCMWLAASCPPSALGDVIPTTAEEAVAVTTTSSDGGGSDGDIYTTRLLS
ncbi:hypothetical protein EV182_000946 [Spiromyces aspiralis]|uniref:Uncharacterized protein n=1 Tax=Spiromyces aspiralis TaxID=68401 RepID=A0ACC1HW42_9FUNG|nr:hypothetical protein EV182_000946 [Spiromyces aspiralis]